MTFRLDERQGRVRFVGTCLAGPSLLLFSYADRFKALELPIKCGFTIFDIIANARIYAESEQYMAPARKPSASFSACVRVYRLALTYLLLCQCRSRVA